MADTATGVSTTGLHAALPTLTPTSRGTKSYKVDSKTGQRVFCREYFSDLTIGQLDSIFVRLSVLEKRIDSEVEKHAREIVSAKFDNIEKDFRESVRENNVRETYDYNSLDGIIKSYKETLCATLKRICREFSTDGEIYVYSKQQKIETTDKSKRFALIGRSRMGLDIPERIIFGSIVNVSRLSERDIAASANPRMYLKQYEHVHLINDYSEDFLIIIREFFSWKDAYLKQYNVFEKSLHSLYHTIIEPYNILQATRLGNNLETSMRITVHEASNVILTVSDTIYRKLGLDYQKENSYIYFPKRISDDDRPLWNVYLRLKTLNNVYKRSTIPFKDINPELDYYDLHRLVYSVKTLFDEKAEMNRYEKIEVYMDKVYNRVRILTDDELFTHIFFNLLDNAVKYGYMGSNISIKVSSEDEAEVGFNSGKVKSVQISVSSFGEQITDQEQEHIRELFKRFNKSGVEGMGVGLFIVQKMCCALGYELNIESTWVSDQNIPAHYWYMVRNPVRKGEGDVKRFLEDTVSDDDVTLVVNPDARWHIGFAEMSFIIGNPTYQNTFTITLKSIYEHKSLLENI